KGVGIDGVLDMAAEHAGEAVERQHRAFACTTAGDDIISRAGVEQHGGEDAVLDIGQLGGIVGGVHAVVYDRVAHRLDNLAQSFFDQRVFGSLAVFVNQCDFHRNNLLLFHSI